MPSISNMIDEINDREILQDELTKKCDTIRNQVNTISKHNSKLRQV